MPFDLFAIHQCSDITSEALSTSRAGSASSSRSNIVRTVVSTRRSSSSKGSIRVSRTERSMGSLRIAGTGQMPQTSNSMWAKATESTLTSPTARAAWMAVIVVPTLVPRV